MATIWYSWSAINTTSTASTTWNHWTTATSTATTSSATTGAVWVEWTGTSIAVPVQAWRQPRLSPEEIEQRRQADERRQAEWQAKADAERKAKEVADQRAEELLHSHLNGRQRRQYRRSKSFIVTGRDGNNYKVGRRWQGHVTRLDARGREVERFCIHPVSEVPLPDNQLIAKLMLETDVEQFKRIANATPLTV